ncbi:hypothetical protein [Microbacterium sp. NPDC087592]|uniref:hypothetical protein n=1 Tax=Microbacterium sp. NPDC087592 TaxID=3364193 RepID=UPI003803F508
MSAGRANKNDLLDFLSKGEAWQAIRGMDAPGLATELDAAGFRRTEPQSDAAKDERVVRYLATATPEPMSEYAPTTEEIREYVETGGEPRPWVALDEAEKSREQARAAAFDRWLAARDAEVRAEAWDEGFTDRHGLPEHRTFLGDRFARNPYRVSVKQGGNDGCRLSNP